MIIQREESKTAGRFQGFSAGTATVPLRETGVCDTGGLAGSLSLWLEI